MKICFIVTPYLHQFLQTNLEIINPPCQWEVIEYTTFEHLSLLAKQLPDSDADGILISGSGAQAVILRAAPELKKPVFSLESDLAGLYRMMLHLMMENRNLDVNRIVMDLFVAINQPFSGKELLDTDKLEDASVVTSQFFSHSSLDELITFEQNIGPSILKQWNEKKLDFVICFFSSAMPYLQEHKIPCAYAYPTITHLRNAIDQILSTITMNRLKGMRTGVICLQPANDKHGVDADFQLIQLQKHLTDYAHQSMFDFLIKRNHSDLEVYTNESIISKLTNHYQGCQISEYLKQKNIDFNIAIGYGLGSNISTAEDNAYEALKQALLREASFLVQENGTLIGPLQGATSSQTPTADARIGELAVIASLSEQTMLKIIHVMERKQTNQISAKDFVDVFGGTTRNANRILGNLSAAGLAKAVGTTSHAKTGRPSQVYEINI